MVASPSLYDPLRDKVEAKQRRDLVLLRMLEQGYITRYEYDEGVLESLPDVARHPAAGRGHDVPVLHLLGQAAGRGQVRRRPGRRAARLRGRADDPHHARLAAPGRRAGRRRRLAAQPGRPARLARRARQRHGRGPRDGRRRRLRDARRSTSPPRASASRARPSSRSSSPRRSRRASRPTPRGPRARSTSASPRRRRAAARSTSTSTTTRTTTRACSRCARATTFSDNSVYAQVGVQVGTKKIAAPRAPDGHPHAGLQEPGDDARRPARGRHAARHGARVPDASPSAAASPTRR